MGNGENLDKYIELEQARREALAARRREHDARIDQASGTISEEWILAKQHEKALADLAIKEGRRVADALLRQDIPMDAYHGRWLPHAIGWYMRIFSSVSSSADDNQEVWHPSYTTEVSGTVLAPSGEILHLVGYRPGNHDPGASAMRRILRKSRHEPYRQDVTSEAQLSSRLKNLAKFVVDHGLEL